MFSPFQLLDLNYVTGDICLKKMEYYVELFVSMQKSGMKMPENYSTSINIIFQSKNNGLLEGQYDHVFTL